MTRVDWIRESSSEEEVEKEKHVRNLVHLMQHHSGYFVLCCAVLHGIGEICGLEKAFLEAEKFEEGEACKSKHKTSSEGVPSFSTCTD